MQKETQKEKDLKKLLLIMIYMHFTNVHMSYVHNKDFFENHVLRIQDENTVEIFTKFLKQGKPKKAMLEIEGVDLNELLGISE